MYDLQDWAAVQRVYKQTRSKRATAKILGMSRNTVRSLLEEKEAPVYKRTVYDLMRSCYEIKNPTCVMKRMKADKSLGYNYDTDRFESDSRKEDDIFLNLEALCENKVETADRSEGAINRNDRIKAMENMVHSLISDRLLELSKYVLLDPIGKRILIDKSSMQTDGYQVLIN